jgi:hypothetical protein
MKYYKNASNEVFAFESDGSQDAYIKPGLTPITAEQADALRVLPPAIPSVLSIRQGRRALYQSGYLSQVDALIASIPGTDGDKARIDWNYATEVRRDHPLVASMAAALPLTESQLDELFTLGATL